MSNDRSNSSVVIFQQNVATSQAEIAIAWKVIENCGINDNHPFTYTYDMEVSSSDSYGNFTPKLGASPGDLFNMYKDDSGDVLIHSPERATDPKEVQLLNKLGQGSIGANIYRDGKLLAQKQVVAPGQKAVFKFHPKIYLGVVSEVQEGEVLDSAIISDVNSLINLEGVSSADIVMTGGGPGKNATSFLFTPTNVKYM